MYNCRECNGTVAVIPEKDPIPYIKHAVWKCLGLCNRSENVPDGTIYDIPCWVSDSKAVSQQMVRKQQLIDSCSEVLDFSTIVPNDTVRIWDRRYLSYSDVVVKRISNGSIGFTHTDVRLCDHRDIENIGAILRLSDGGLWINGR